jgi:hypothetical protein
MKSTLHIPWPMGRKSLRGRARWVKLAWPTVARHGLAHWSNCAGPAHWGVAKRGQGERSGAQRARLKHAWQRWIASGKVYTMCLPGL